MTSGAPTPSAMPRGFPRVYPPMAVAYGDGPDSGAGADAAREVATAEGFDGPKLTILDAARDLPLGQYPLLTVVAPSIEAAGSERVALLQPVRNLIGGYRGCRPEGLPHLRAGLVEPYKAGIVQVVARGELLADPALTEMFARACARHTLESLLEDPTVILKIFDDESPDASPATLVRLDEDYITALWTSLRDWKVRHIDDVDPLLDRLTGMREYFRRSARNGLRKPLGEADPRTRLDLVLDYPDAERPNMSDKARAAWLADGAEVMRTVIAAFNEVVPGLKNPAATRGVRKFSRFCEDLKNMSYYLKTVPEAQRPPFSHE